MKAIKHNGQIGSISAKVDGSVAYRVNTPELSAEEKSAMFELQNKNVSVLISPFGEPDAEVLTIKKDLETKTPSQRLRAVLFLLYEKDHEGHHIFDTFYETKMEKFIDHVKGKLDG